MPERLFSDRPVIDQPAQSFELLEDEPLGLFFLRLLGFGVGLFLRLLV